MAGNFRGNQFSRFTGDPQKSNPRNKKLKRTRDNRGRGHHAWCVPLLDNLFTSHQLIVELYTNISSLDHMRLVPFLDLL